LILTVRDALRKNVFDRYKGVVNMGVRDLRRWGRDERSKVFNTNERRNIGRNVELLRTKFMDWDAKHFRWAEMIIGNVRRLKRKSLGVRIKGLSRRTILLMHNGFNPNKK
jgi:hypothetical protein